MIARCTIASEAGTTTVLIDMRFFGAVWISERSRTPISDMCSVRGIGVAESVSTSTEVLALLEALLVHDAEALLFVDDDQPEIVEGDVFLQQPVRADDDVDLALGQIGQDRLLLLCVLKRESSSMRIGKPAKRALKVR